MGVKITLKIASLMNYQNFKILRLRQLLPISYLITAQKDENGAHYAKHINICQLNYYGIMLRGTTLDHTQGLYITPIITLASTDKPISFK